LANRYWPGENAVGRSVRIDDAVRRVVGVVADSHVSGAGPVPPTVFVPARDDPDRRAPLLLLSEAATAGSIALIRQMEPRASVSVIRLADQLRASFGNLRSSAQLVTALGILALLLATTGVYGVASYTVEQSRQEIGIRMALGARPRAAVGAILGRHARGFGFGLLAGVVLATLGSSAIESQLYGIGRFDPLAYGGVLLLLLSVGAVASVIPAQRAARAEAVTTLRHQ
jgi:ABC-type antimicrobial peptide transport system permease subunit